MIDYGIVRSTVKPQEKVIDEYSVWINTNIKEVNVSEEEVERIEFEFNQVQYSKEEYIKIMDEKNLSLESELTDTQIALCEVYELIGG